ncbi:MAG: hypothetical protein ACHQ4G_10010, partial [Opitutales bacterium]
MQLPALKEGLEMTLEGEYRSHPDARGLETGCPALSVRVNGQAAGRLANLRPGPFRLTLLVPAISGHEGA